MARGFAYLAAVVATMHLHCAGLVQPQGFVVAAVDHDGRGILHRSGGGSLGKVWKTGDFTAKQMLCRDNTDQGSQFNSEEFTGLLIKNGVKISMDGKGGLRDNVFVERIWRSVKYKEAYLRAYTSVPEARASLGRYLTFYKRVSLHPSLYVVVGNRLCC